MTYRYTASDPRTNAMHYMYAPFEGRALLVAHASQRRELERALPEGAPVPPSTSLPAVPAEVRTSRCLADCVAMVEAGRGPEAGAWAEFFRRKVEIPMRLRAAYGADGRMTDGADAGADAYAYAACLFALLAHGSDGLPRLRWINACLKALDILSVVGLTTLSPEGAGAARRAVSAEREVLAGIASARGVAW